MSKLYCPNCNSEDIQIDEIFTRSMFQCANGDCTNEAYGEWGYCEECMTHYFKPELLPWNKFKKEGK